MIGQGLFVVIVAVFWLAEVVSGSMVVYWFVT
jgi:hypothetical protein